MSGSYQWPTASEQGTGYWFVYEDKYTGRPQSDRFPINADVRFHFRTRTENHLYNSNAPVRGVFYLIKQTSPHMAGKLLGMETDVVVFCMRAGYCKTTISHYVNLRSFLHWGQWPSGATEGPVISTLPTSISPVKEVPNQLPASLPSSRPNSGKPTSIFIRGKGAPWVQQKEPQKLYELGEGSEGGQFWPGYAGQEAILIRCRDLEQKWSLDRWRQLLSGQLTTVQHFGGNAVAFAGKRIYVCSPEGMYKTFGDAAAELEELFDCILQLNTATSKNQSEILRLAVGLD